MLALGKLRVKAYRCAHIEKAGDLSEEIGQKIKIAVSLWPQPTGDDSLGDNVDAQSHKIGGKFRKVTVF